MRRNPKDVSFSKIVEARWKYDSWIRANDLTRVGPAFSHENIKLKPIGDGGGVMWCMGKKSPISTEWAWQSPIYRYSH
jgi:hypothetical protein